jgi:hypothetical protein
MSTTDRCPYCGQELGSDAAVEHLHQAEEKFRRQLVAEAEAKA